MYSAQNNEPNVHMFSYVPHSCQLGSPSHSVLYEVVGCYEDCTEAANLNRCMSATTKKSAGDRKRETFVCTFLQIKD